MLLLDIMDMHPLPAPMYNAASLTLRLAFRIELHKWEWNSVGVDETVGNGFPLMLLFPLLLFDGSIRMWSGCSGKHGRGLGLFIFDEEMGLLSSTLVSILASALVSTTPLAAFRSWTKLLLWIRVVALLIILLCLLCVDTSLWVDTSWTDIIIPITNDKQCALRCLPNSSFLLKASGQTNGRVQSTSLARVLLAINNSSVVLYTC